MFSYFIRKKEIISECLTKFFQNDISLCHPINRFSQEVPQLLLEYALSGKMIRGGLVYLGYELTGKETPASLVYVASAIELLQSALLIHDDIMDQDELRRGKPTVHITFATKARTVQEKANLQLGTSLAICVGDIAFFLAGRLLGQADLPLAKLKELLALLNKELVWVGLAQMEDVYLSLQAFGPGLSEADILNLYRYKTGRYSFSLPLSCGALLAGLASDEIGLLESLGEDLGLIFQLKDDELGLFSSEEDLGKPIGSDLRQGKKTLLLVKLWPTLSESERKEVLLILKNPSQNQAQLEFIRQLLREKGICHQQAILINKLAHSCQEKIAQFKSIADPSKEILSQLINYSLKRNF